MNPKEADIIQVRESDNNQFRLLTERRFLPLFITQFLGALNDNLFRNALIILVAFLAKPAFLNEHIIINLCTALFVIPYFIFSSLAGELADKYEKSKLIRYVKAAEVVLTAIAVLGFTLGHLYLLMTTLFLLGTQATFFGPLKYSILPEHLKESELLGGNGLIEMGTFIAILIGTLLGGIFVGIPDTGLVWVSVSMSIAALLGFSSSLYIPKAKAEAPHLKIDFNILRQSVFIVKTACQKNILRYSIFGISWFWMYGSIFLTQIANYTKDYIHGNEQVATILLFTFSVGIGLGSTLCEKLAGKKIETGLIPFGGIGLTLFAIDLSFANIDVPHLMMGAGEFLSVLSHWRIIIDALLMGTFGGFFLVPLYATLQARSEPEIRSRVVAANNIINAIFMTVASFMSIVVLNSGFSIPDLFRLTGILNAVVIIWMCYKEREFFTRFKIWIKNR